MNFPEKIIFVIDTFNESSESESNSEGNNYSFFFMVKRAIEIFLHNKTMLNKQHEFALMTIMGNKASWLCDFSDNLSALTNLLESLEDNESHSDNKFFDANQVFEMIYQEVIQNILPAQNQIVRTIFLYSRSNIIPRFNAADQIFQQLMRYQYFFLDILYIHDPPSSDNQCELIYNELNKLELNKSSYIMEVAKNVVKLNKCMAILLAHPFQRTLKPQNFSIHPSIINMVENENQNKS